MEKVRVTDTVSKVRVSKIRTLPMESTDMANLSELTLDKEMERDVLHDKALYQTVSKDEEEDPKLKSNPFLDCMVDWGFEKAIPKKTKEELDKKYANQALSKLIPREEVYLKKVDDLGLKKEQLSIELNALMKQFNELMKQQNDPEQYGEISGYEIGRVKRKLVNCKMTHDRIKDEYREAAKVLTEIQVNINDFTKTSNANFVSNAYADMEPLLKRINKLGAASAKGGAKAAARSKKHLQKIKDTNQALANMEEEEDDDMLSGAEAWVKEMENNFAQIYATDTLPPAPTFKPDIKPKDDGGDDDNGSDGDKGLALQL